jgi:hypothetical protein
MEEKKYLAEAELEAARLEVLKKGGKHLVLGRMFFILALLSGFSIMLGFGVPFFFEGTKWEFILPLVWIFGSLALCIVYGLLGNKQSKKYMEILSPYNEKYKMEFLPAILAERFDKLLAYEPAHGFDREVVKDAGIFPSFEMITTNDYIRAEHGGLLFEFCDLLLQREVESTNDDSISKSIETAFQGIFIIASFDHFSDTPLLIRAGGGKGNFTTESDAFNAQFSMDTDDPVGALRILTPQMMEHILIIKNRLGGSVNLCFKNDKIYFCTSRNKDTLEIALDVTQPIAVARKQVDNDISFILEVVGLLNARNLKSSASKTEATSSKTAYQNEQRYV